MRANLFHNPTAGEGAHSQKKLLTLLRNAGFSATYCSTKASNFLEALGERADLFVAAGGDGTVGKVLKQMPDRTIPVAILPLGIANNIAHSLGIVGELENLAFGLQTARRQRFDIGLACGPWGRRLFVEAVGLGGLTAAMARIDAVKIERADGIGLGRDTFRKVLAKAKPFPIDMTIDGRSLDEELILAEILNIPYAGPSLALAPPSGIGDGLFDIVCMSAEQRGDMVAWLGASQPNVPPPITLQQGRKISLRWEGSPLRIDDDCPSMPNRGDRVTVELEREAATILVPKLAGDTKSKRKQSKQTEAA